MNYLEDLETAWQMRDDDPARIKVLEQAILGADMYNDIPNGIEARDMLIDTCLYVGFPKKQLQAFSWLVKKFEEDCPDVDGFDLLWKYKWIAEHVPMFDEVSKAQIDALLNDMKVKFEQRGYSLRPYYKVSTLGAMRMGDRAKAEAYFEQWQKAKSDYMNDCGACETNDVVHYHYFMEDYEQALKKAAPIVTGKQSCAEVPHLTYGFTVIAYFKTGDLEMAQQCFEKGYPLVEKKSSLIPPMASMIQYLNLSGQHEKAKDVIAINKETALASESGLDKLLFLQAAFPFFDAEVDKDLIQLTEELTAKFDARNENSYYSERLAK
ncbi:hypothetical protein [Listeria booriae]|uniref:hypothetical protein n=1 Tax=Listeria booriae TaxID=1552123 RepID=UPI00162468BA|nr:hypothetical protein [Listeria booriae]MBC1983825.1 hypothetical protein [Listeria booriae]MBC2079290.1 hypothetical protein [Listeria booriae]